MADTVQSGSVVGVFTTDSELRIKVWDNALVRFTGVSADSSRGKLIQELFPEVETRGLHQKLENVLRDGTVEVLAPAFHQYLIPCPPQAPSTRFDKMLQRTTIVPVVENDVIVGVLVTIEDVTTRVEREHELNELLNSNDAETRLRATEALAQSDEIEDELGLLGAVGDSDWRVRKTAIHGLAKRSAPEAIQALLESLREDHGDLGVLNSALQVLSMVDIETLPTLLEFLHDAKPDLRMQAALALGEQRDRRAVPALLEALNDSDPNVRFHAIEALGKLRDPAAAVPLATIAESEDFFLSFPALDALKELGDSSITPRLIDLLSVQTLRQPVAEAIGALGDETVVDALASILNAESAAALPVSTALTALYDRFEQLHGEGDYIADLSRQSIKTTGMQHLLDALGDTESEHLRPLAVVIGWLRGPAVDRTLVRLLGESSVRTEVLEALTHHGEGVINLLIDRLESDDIETRRASVLVLGRLGYRRATGALTKVLEIDPLLRADAANALARIGDDAALDSLLNLIGDPDGAVRQAVVGALNSIGSSRMPHLIKPLLLDERPLVRESAAKIAGYFGYSNCADLLLKSCGDEDERVRKAAVEHLPYLEDERVPQVLAETLKTDTPKVRAAAAAAMGIVEGSETNLIKALKDEDPWVRYFASQSLGRLGNPNAVSALIEVAHSDSFNHVRIAAIQSLGKLGGQSAVEAIRKQLGSTDKDVARVAAEALEEVRKLGVE